MHTVLPPPPHGPTTGHAVDVPIAASITSPHDRSTRGDGSTAALTLLRCPSTMRRTWGRVLGAPAARLYLLVLLLRSEARSPKRLIVSDCCVR